MTLPIAGQEPIKPEREDVKAYRVSDIEDASGLYGVVFNLPFSRKERGIKPKPLLCIYGGEASSGYSFQGESFIAETVTGIEKSDTTERLESGDYPASGIEPFLGRKDDLKDGFRRYVLPVDGEASYEVVADIRPDEERSHESVKVTASKNGEELSSLFLGRTDDNWEYIQKRLGHTTKV